MDLVRLTNKLSHSERLNQSNGLRKSIRETPALLKTLYKLILRRQRFTFQLFKYFVLFPGSSQISQDISIDSYDRLIFGDDAIHSMVKIYQVKQIQNKIWAFLNIKALKYLQTCKQFTKKIEKIYSNKFQIPIKSDVFKTIKQYDMFIQNQIKQGRLRLGSKSKYVDQQANTQHKLKLGQRSNLYEVKIEGKNYLGSKIAIQSSMSGENKSKFDQNSKNIDHVKLSESQNFTQQLIQTQSRIPSNIDIKSNISQEDESKLKRNSNSQTKIRFTYTSPSKQQIKVRMQPASKISQKKRKNSQQALSDYKYKVPKYFEQKKICCQNWCGTNCCTKCQYETCKEGNKRVK